MSWQAIEAVLRFSQAKGRARLLLLAIAHHAGPDGKGARPGAALLSTETKIARRDLQRLTRQLQESGELTVKTGGGERASEYTLFANLPAGQWPASGQETGGPNPARRATDSPPQQTVVVSDVVVLKNKTTLALELESVGVASSVAMDLANRFPERVPIQLACLSDRNPRDRAATLVDSIRGNWAPPAAYLKRIEAARAQEAQRDANARQIASQAALRAAQEVSEAEQIQEAARLDAAFDALGAAEKAALDAEVEKRMELLLPRMRTDFGRKMMRRELLKGENHD